jgi:hypothetical protein
MATTEQGYTGDGNQVNFSVPFPYLLQTDVTVTVDDVVQTLGPANDYVFSQSNQITFNVAPANLAAILFKRETNAEELPVDFSAGTSLRAVDLNSNFKQNLYIAQETQNQTVTASSGNLADGAVTNAKIANGAVNTLKLADNSVTTAKIVDGDVTDAKIATVTGTKVTQATTSVRGTVQLTNSLVDTSETLAATAKAVNDLNTSLTAAINTIDATQPFTRTSTGVNDTIDVGEHVTVTAAGVTITLPTGTDGDTVRISVGSFTNTIVSSPQNIMASASDLTIDVALKTVTLMYDDNQDGGLSVVGWRII